MPRLACHARNVPRLASPKLAEPMPAQPRRSQPCQNARDAPRLPSPCHAPDRRAETCPACLAMTLITGPRRASPAQPKLALPCLDVARNASPAKPCPYPDASRLITPCLPCHSCHAYVDILRTGLSTLTPNHLSPQAQTRHETNDERDTHHLNWCHDKSSVVFWPEPSRMT